MLKDIGFYSAVFGTIIGMQAMLDSSPAVFQMHVYSMVIALSWFDIALIIACAVAIVSIILDKILN